MLELILEMSIMLVGMLVLKLLTQEILSVFSKPRKFQNLKTNFRRYPVMVKTKMAGEKFMIQSMQATG